MDAPCQRSCTVHPVAVKRRPRDRAAPLPGTGPAANKGHLRVRPEEGMIPEDTIRRQLTRTLETTCFHGLGARYQGKVRDCYVDQDAGQRVIVATDRISAFDRVLGTVPFKGQVLNQLSAWWFEKGRGVAPNHVIAIPDPQVTVAHECTPLRVEMIVRAYMAGVTTTSIWYNYERGVRNFCGNPLPDG